MKNLIDRRRWCQLREFEILLLTDKSILGDDFSTWSIALWHICLKYSQICLGNAKGYVEIQIVYNYDSIKLNFKTYLNSTLFPSKVCVDSGFWKKVFSLKLLKECQILESLQHL